MAAPVPISELNTDIILNRMDGFSGAGVPAGAMNISMAGVTTACRNIVNIRKIAEERY